MAFGFVKKTWKDRISEYPTRRTLTKEDGSTELVTVSRSEGTVSQEGDAFSADNMNDLETRVDNALNEVNSNLKPITSMIEITVTKGECTLPQSVLNDYNGNYICISQPNVVGTTPCVRYNSLKAKYATQKGSGDYSLTFDWNGSINIFVTIIKIK